MLLILALRLILRSSRFFSKSSRITLHFRPFKVTGLFTLRSVLFSFDSSLIQLIGQDFQPFLFAVKLLLLRKRLCYDFFGFVMVKPEYALFCRQYCRGQLQGGSSYGQNSQSALRCNEPMIVRIIPETRFRSLKSYKNRSNLLDKLPTKW